MLAESVASEGLVGAKESTSKMAPSHGCCQKASVPYQWTSPQSCVSVLMTWLPHAIQEKEQGRSHSTFYVLVSEVTNHHSATSYPLKVRH